MLYHAVVWTLGISLAMACGRPAKTASKGAADLEAAVASSAPMYTALTKMRDSFPAAATKPCEPMPSASTATFSWNMLLYRTAAPPAMTRSADAADPNGINSQWISDLQVTGTKPKYFRGDDPLRQRQAFDAFNSATRVHIVRAIDVVPPRVAAGQYTPGMIAGIVAGFAADGTLQCASTITATNSAGVSFASRPGTTNNDQAAITAVNDDLRKQFESAARSVVHRGVAAAPEPERTP